MLWLVQISKVGYILNDAVPSWRYLFIYPSGIDGVRRPVKFGLIQSDFGCKEGQTYQDSFEVYFVGLDWAHENNNIGDCRLNTIVEWS